MIIKKKISGDVLQGLKARSYTPCVLLIRSYLCVVMEHFDFEIKKTNYKSGPNSNNLCLFSYHF